MKKNILFLALALMLAFSSCSKGEDMVVHRESNHHAIYFRKRCKSRIRFMGLTAMGLIFKTKNLLNSLIYGH